MATIYDYENRTAFNPETGEGTPNAVGQVFAKTDTTFATPLVVTLMGSGLSVTDLTTDQYCQLQGFQAADLVQVVFKSGDFTKVLNTTTPLVGPAGPAVSDAVDNGNNTVTFLLEDGTPAATVALPASDVPGPEGPPGPRGLPGPDAIPADEAVATYATTPGTATAAALSSTVASETATKIPLRVAGDRFRTLTVIVYHPINITNFRNDLDYYQEWNYTTVTSRQVWEHLEGISTLPDKPLWITFDDGLPTQYTAAEELKNRGMKGIFYIASGWIDGTVTQAQGGFAEATPLTWAQIQQMHAWGHDIQSHTKNHYPLGDQVEATVKAEFVDSKARIEQMVPGTLVEYIAYPYGSWNDNVAVWLESVGCKLGRQVRTATDGRDPGPNRGRYAIATTAHRRFGIPCAGASAGDVQQPNYYRSLSADPELIPDFGFEAGGKGWQLGSGHTVDTTDAYAGTKSLHAVQGTSTTSSRPLRAIHVGRWARLQLKVRIKTVGLPAGTLTKLQLQPLKTDGTVITTIDAVTVTGNNGAWTEYTYEYIGSSDVDTVLVYPWLQKHDTAPTGAAWFDAVSLKRESANAPFGGLY